MEFLGKAVVWKLIALGLALTVVGCSSQVGPNDPSMSATDEAKIRESTMTAEEKQAQASRPR
jgi:hypothetical protein